jgi:hypothetical protein
MLPSFVAAAEAETNCRCVFKGKWDNAVTAKVCDPNFWGTGSHTYTSHDGHNTVTVRITQVYIIPWDNYMADFILYSAPFPMEILKVTRLCLVQIVFK